MGGVCGRVSFGGSVGSAFCLGYIIGIVFLILYNQIYPLISYCALYISLLLVKNAISGISQLKIKLQRRNLKILKIEGTE